MSLPTPAPAPVPAAPPAERIRIEKFMVQLALANPHDGRPGTVWKDEIRFQRELVAFCELWGSMMTTGPQPACYVTREEVRG